MSKEIILPLSVMLIALVMLPGCSSEDPQVAPLKSEIEANVKLALPPFLSLASFESEVIPVVENRVKINFKSNVKASEDLFITDRFLGDDRSQMILKQSQSAGSEMNLYGSVTAERNMDKWDFSRPQIDSGLAQLGSPRGAFDSRALVDGSEAFKNFFAEREAKRAEQVKIAEERERQNEEARIALLEKQRQEQEAVRKKLLEATAVGKRYKGILVESPGGSSETRQAVELQFTSQEKSLITAELHNPDEPSHKQTFTGELVFEQQPETNRSNNRHYPIILSPKQASRARVSENDRDRFRIYFEECILSLDLTDQGLEGEALTSKYGAKYGLRMQTVE